MIQYQKTNSCATFEPHIMSSQKDASFQKRIRDGKKMTSLAPNPLFKKIMEIINLRAKFGFSMIFGLRVRWLFFCPSPFWKNMFFK